MTTILHTADWHLGQNFYDYDRTAEHRAFLAWLHQQLGQHGVDVLLVAGDVFDGPNPSAQSQQMYYRFLRQATEAYPHLQVIIIAGNHDSAARLEAPQPLLEDMRVTVRGMVTRTPEGEIDYARLIVPLHKGGHCLTVPYLRQGDYPAADTYAQGVQRMYEEMYQQASLLPGPLIAMGHLQATGSEVSEHDRAERTIIGGLESVSPQAFHPDIAYVALGHLHKGQRVSGREQLRYSGAPLPMSFAEKHYKHGVVLVHLQQGEPAAIEPLLFDPPARLLSIPPQPAPLAQVLEAIEALPVGEQDTHTPYLEVKVLITEPEPSLRHKIELALQGKAVRLTRISATTMAGHAAGSTLSTHQLQEINPMDMAQDVFGRRYGGQPMPNKMQELLQQVIQEATR